MFWSVVIALSGCKGRDPFVFADSGDTTAVAEDAITCDRSRWLVSLIRAASTS